MLWALETSPVDSILIPHTARLHRTQRTRMEKVLDPPSVSHSESGLDRLYQSLETAGVLGVDELTQLKILFRRADTSVADRATFLNRFGRLLKARYDATSRKEFLNSSILVYDLAAEIAPRDDPKRAELLIDAGSAYDQRFDLDRKFPDIGEAISKFKAAISQTPQTHQKFPVYLGSLGLLYLKRFERFGDLTDLSRAISEMQTAIQFTPANQPNRSNQLNNLALALQYRFEHNGDVKDLLESISTLQTAISLAPGEGPYLPSLFNNLGISLLHHFKCTKSIEALSESITRFRIAIRLSPDRHPDLLPRLNNLGTSLRHRFECTGNIADLSESISQLQTAIHLSPDDNANKLGSLNNLGASLRCRFEHTGDIADLQASISALRTSIRLTPDGDVNIPSRLANLGALLQLSFRHIGNLSELSESITTLRTAIQHTSSDHIDLPSFLHNLGTSLRYRFNHVGDIGDLSESISTLRTAIHLTPHGHANQPIQLSNLGTLLRLRFEHVGDIADLSDSISTLRTAIQLIPEGHADLPITLSNLANSLLDHFQSVGQRVDDITNLLDSITCLEKAVHLTHDNHVERPGHLTDLGNSLLLRTRHRPDKNALPKVISTLRTAIDLTPKDHMHRPSRLCSLGYALQLRFEHVREISDLTESISLLRTAISLTPPGHSSRSGRLSQLGTSLCLRFQHFHDMDDIMSAIDAYHQAATLKSGPSASRLAASRDWAALSHQFKPSEALEAYALSINLLSQVAGMEKTISIRHEKLIDISDLTSTAASAALSFGSPMLALEWLERGRCLVWTQLNQLRTPLDELRSVEPDLADQLSKVSRALERAGSRETFSTGQEKMYESKDKASLEDQAADHMRLANEWDQLLDKVRQIPNFQNFLSPCQGSHLMKHLPSGGPVIVINVHKTRCDALALFAQQNEPFHIPLQFTYKQAEELRSSLLNHLSAERLRMPDGNRAIRRYEPPPKSNIIRKLLEDLWKAVAKPILDAIDSGFNSSLPSGRRRIWWCATGPLAFLPLHAAGIYNEPPGTSLCVSDFAVSSYIPNVTTLIDMVKDNGTSQAQSSNSFLLVSQAKTPKLAPIPYADEEVGNLLDLMQETKIKAVRLSGKDATVNRVYEEMGMHRNVHLACHAVQDIKCPLKSGFYLLDGQLELSKITNRKIPNAEMAFLSACQTSTGDERLSEEAVHLAAGMLAAGYRSVIATMWSISDTHGPAVAKKFYSQILNETAQGDAEEPAWTMSDGRAAHALHHAIQRLRRDPTIGNTEKGLLTWVPYVHFGI